MFNKFTKAVLSVTTAAIILTSFSSCYRTYTCQCEISYTGKPGLPETFTKDYEIQDAKKTAKSTCEASSKTTVTEGIITTERCYIY